ncbi:hypothetical protein EDB86DRAFT_2888705 [Lactarius hatsudake]|nr:hypothetical protein EDB86DRAFT_2888705 [Lactarius hatsudake]
MTNISNYGPVRRMSPPVSADRKPYSRTGLKGVLGTLDLNSGDAVVPPTLDSPYYPFHVEIPQLEAPTQSRFTVPDGSRDITGFPTYEQYQRIEEEYLTSLSERKQPKALISQSLFDKIYAVLQNGSEDRASTAQFRFWVRKMFVLAYPQTSFNTGQTPEPVVLHDRRPVAIKERLYEVLCYCHAIARHGGRDKTCATLRLHYSWVPKELTAKFVKACPTCTLKRSGNPDLLSRFNYAPPTYLQTAPEPPTGGPDDSSPGLNLIGPSGYDNNNNAAGASGFTPSIFTTPDLSVYPSPTLSSGSGGGPMTPSPYLHHGLFGYPAVFDPGHNSLSSVARWDPSPSPCGPGYAGGSDEPLLREAPEQQQQQQPGSADDEPIDSHLHLPTPRKARIYDFSARAEPPPPSSIGTEGTERSSTPPSVLESIDPALFMEGFPTPGPGPARRADTDADENPSAPWETPSLCLLLHLQSRPSSRTSCGPAPPPPLLSPPPVPTCERGCSAGVMFAPVPLRMKSVLCSMMEAEAETETEIEEGEVVEMTLSCRSKRWESPEAWLVPSDSADEADAISG